MIILLAAIARQRRTTPLDRFNNRFRRRASFHLHRFIGYPFPVHQIYQSAS